MKPMSDKLQFVVLLVNEAVEEAGDKLKFVGHETNCLIIRADEVFLF